MIAHIGDNGRFVLADVRVDEVKLLHEALEKWANDLTERAAQLEVEAGERMEFARGRRAGKRQAIRVAGELRNEAAGWRALAKDASDMLRALLWAATHKDAR